MTKFRNNDLHFSVNKLIISKVETVEIRVTFC